MTARQSRVLQVHNLLLGELRAGSRRPGTAINVKEVAERLRLSGTPVREALERLVGEGMVVATGDGHGFATPRLRPKELAGHHEVLGTLLESAARRAGTPRTPQPTAPGYASRPATAVEEAFRDIAAAAANPVLLLEVSRLGNVIAPYRRFEPDIIRGWSDELARIEGADRPDLMAAAVRAISRSRRLHAADIVEAAEQ